MYNNKKELICEFRNMAKRELWQIQQLTQDYKTQAKLINTVIKNFKDNIIEDMLCLAERNQWVNDDILNAILHITYASSVVMLEYRNHVWPYEYMAFARRIGELWEPFCKETFYHSITPLEIIEPPSFHDIQRYFKQATTDFINLLHVDSQTKRMLHYYYSIPWTLVDSGGIQMNLDLHFKQCKINYNCDFKSGFSSNEKGNTNRLLLVANIYRLLSDNQRTILFVRQNEDENNNYLQKLKNSGLWKVYCSDEAYTKMFQFTGFNLRSWIDNNVTWIEDISPELRTHLTDKEMINYLTW